MSRKWCSEGGVSEVVGEMLMIGLVVILLSVFSAALFSFIPADRDPSIAVMITNDHQNVTFWHKGGDWVKYEDLRIVIGNDTNRATFSKNNGNMVLVPEKSVFDLGSNITVRAEHDFEGNETVRMITPRSVISVGRIRL